MQNTARTGRYLAKNAETHTAIRSAVSDMPKSEVRRTNTHPFVTSSLRPHDRINIDTFHVGTEDEHGNKFVVVIVDTCTRWVELYPIPNKEADTIAFALIKHFGRYGPPKVILTDQGTEYYNKVMKFLTKWQSIHYQTTPIAHSHEHNSRVERVNKELKRHLINYCEEVAERGLWSFALPAVQYIINTTRNAQTNYTPFELLFGPAVNSNPLHLESEDIPETILEASEWMVEQRRIHEDMLSKARQLQQELDREHLESRPPEEVNFAAGDYVLVGYPDSFFAGSAKPPTKLLPYRKGPMKILEISGDAYTVLDLVSRNASTVHVSRIYPFYYDPSRVDPENIALRDSEEFVVESIIDDTIDNQSKRKWQFRVRWKGYDESADTWSSWDSLKDVGVLHDYLRSQGRTDAIPRSHQSLNDRTKKSETPLLNSDTTTPTNTKTNQRKRKRTAT